MLMFGMMGGMQQAPMSTATSVPTVEVTNSNMNSGGQTPYGPICNLANYRSCVASAENKLQKVFASGACMYSPYFGCTVQNYYFQKQNMSYQCFLKVKSACQAQNQAAQQQQETKNQSAQNGADDSIVTQKSAQKAAAEANNQGAENKVAVAVSNLVEGLAALAENPAKAGVLIKNGTVAIEMARELKKQAKNAEKNSESLGEEKTKNFSEDLTPPQQEFLKSPPIAKAISTLQENYGIEPQKFVTDLLQPDGTSPESIADSLGSKFDKKSLTNAIAISEKTPEEEKNEILKTSGASILEQNGYVANSVARSEAPTRISSQKTLRERMKNQLGERVDIDAESADSNLEELPNRGQNEPTAENHRLSAAALSAGKVRLNKPRLPTGNSTAAAFAMTNTGPYSQQSFPMNPKMGEPHTQIRWHDNSLQRREPASLENLTPLSETDFLNGEESGEYKESSLFDFVSMQYRKREYFFELRKKD